MHILAYILIATAVVSLIAFIGIFTFALKDKLVKKLLLILVAQAAGALMGGAFIHLLPEAVEQSNPGTCGFFVLLGFAIFFVIERILYWRHCHKGKCDVHTFTYMNLIGDAIHNFIDGVIIAISFLVSTPFGIITTIAILAHEIPQEIGDFGVLVYGGFSKLKALFFNFLTALAAIAGALFGYFLSALVEKSIVILLPIAAGGFIYIAASDLVPELHKEPDIKKSLYSFAFFIVGIGLMWFIKFIFEH